jgi:putative hemolysin
MTSPDGPVLMVILLAIVGCILLNAFFTLAEVALVTVRNSRLQQLVAEGADGGGGAGVQDLLRRPTRLVATVQVGVTLASFAVASLAAATLAPAWAPWLRRHHVPHELRVAATLLTLLFALLTIVLGEIVPRSIAQRDPERVALRVQKPLRVWIALLSPLAAFALWLSNLVVRPFGLTASFAVPLITEEELRALVEAGAQSGAIEEEERQIIRNVISFGDREARQVMTPRIDIKAAAVFEGLPALLKIVMESGHSRIPVYETSVDAIIGIVHAKDLLPALARSDQSVELQTLIRPPLIVPENRPVASLLDEFRRTHIHLAIVQDEYGGTAGLVTLEDLLEELVGEIADEHDVEEASVQVIGPQEDFDTVGGFVFGLFGHRPARGESVRYENLEFTVEKIAGRHVQQIRLRRLSLIHQRVSEITLEE